MATFIFPTKVRRITSKFRTKSRPNHNGIDIAQAGTHSIFAVADGVVSKSYTSSSYGECVAIVHNINGQVWESLYAHLRKGSRKVRVGHKVKQGDVIGIMGNTGRSSGQHLHFELHKGRWNYNKSNAVDPLAYLEKNLSPKSKKLKVDGKWGNDTTRALQEFFGTKADGILSKQSKNTVTEALYGNTVHYGKGGSLVIKSLQKYLNSKGYKLKVDGLLGPATVRALQSYLGTVVDGKLSRPSLVVKAMQKRLNAGKL